MVETPWSMSEFLSLIPAPAPNSGFLLKHTWEAEGAAQVMATQSVWKSWIEFPTPSFKLVQFDH